jgi:hypothetical protein
MMAGPSRDDGFPHRSAFVPTRLGAQERAGDAALGVVSGAVVLGPIGAAAGALIGYTAGPAIARSWGIRRSKPRHGEHSATRPMGRAINAVPAASIPQRPKEIAAQPSLRSNRQCAQTLCPQYHLRIPTMAARDSDRSRIAFRRWRTSGPAGNEQSGLTQKIILLGRQDCLPRLLRIRILPHVQRDLKSASLCS